MNSKKNISKLKEIEIKIFKDPNVNWSILNFSEICGEGGLQPPLPIAGYGNDSFIVANYDSTNGFIVNKKFESFFISLNNTLKT